MALDFQKKGVAGSAFDTRLRNYVFTCSESPLPITRRDFLGSVLLASGAVLLESRSPAELAADNFPGNAGVSEYSTSNGNTWEVIQAGHSIRYATYDPLPKDVIDTGETNPRDAPEYYLSASRMSELDPGRARCQPRRE